MNTSWSAFCCCLHWAVTACIRLEARPVVVHLTSSTLFSAPPEPWTPGVAPPRASRQPCPGTALVKSPRSSGPSAPLVLNLWIYAIFCTTWTAGPASVARLQHRNDVALTVCDHSNGLSLLSSCLVTSAETCNGSQHNRHCSVKTLLSSTFFHVDLQLALTRCFSSEHNNFNFVSLESRHWSDWSDCSLQRAVDLNCSATMLTLLHCGWAIGLVVVDLASNPQPPPALGAPVYCGFRPGPTGVTLPSRQDDESVRAPALCCCCCCGEHGTDWWRAWGECTVNTNR